MRPKLSSIIVLICIVLLPLLTGASPEVLKAIEEYQRVQNTNRRVRIFPFDEGNPSYLGYSFTDSDGYQWFSSYNPWLSSYDILSYSHYRFDGDRFVDMFEGYLMLSAIHCYSVAMHKHTMDQSMWPESTTYISGKAMHGSVTRLLRTMPSSLLKPVETRCCVLVKPVTVS